MQHINEIEGGWPDDQEEHVAAPVIDFNALQAERNQLAILLDQGLEFQTPSKSLLRFVSKTKQRTWLLKQPYLGTLDRLSAEFIDLDFSEELVKANGMAEARRLTAHNAKRCARIVAIACLNGKWAIRLGTYLLSQYFLWRITPSILFQLVMIINEMSNLADFTNSIRLMFISPRTTAPTLIEEKKAGAGLRV